MWSLYNKKEGVGGDIGDSLGENLFDYDGEKLEPLKFSNGKTQADVVKEVLDEIEKGNKIIFIRGVCGTGKSAIALNLARHFKKTAIVVPIKTLQAQYENDYTKEKFILRKDKKKLRIAVIKGRNNFSCPYGGENAGDSDLPCTIEFREKNMSKIMDYIGQNEGVSKLDFSSISDVRRMSVAPACPYWSPILPSDLNSRALDKAKKKSYMAVCGKSYSFFSRKKGCGYYDQYDDYCDADVLIFNSMKYILETFMGRKPKTDLDIIDECDEFLDKFANERKININRFIMVLSNLFPETREEKNAIKEMIHLANGVLFDSQSEVEKIENTPVLNLFKKILENPYIAEDEDGNYYNNVFEIAKSFEKLLDETYVSIEKIEGEQETLFGKRDDSVIVNLVSINLAQRFKDIVETNNVLVLMSGTLHSENVLRDIFGLKNFKVIEAESNLPGTITKYRTGLEKDFKYANFRSGIVNREDYLRALNSCIANVKPPALVHVNAFDDMPTSDEIEMFGLDFMISREKLREMQSFSGNRNIDKFKQGEMDFLFTTKCSRGVDFPGEKCNSVVLTKYPYPNIRGLFWQILKKEQPDKFFEFYMDKANRELIQKIARAVRFKGDHVLLFSPDVRVLNARLG